jgi:hypothetical protein
MGEKVGGRALGTSHFHTTAQGDMNVAPAILGQCLWNEFQVLAVAHRTMDVLNKAFAGRA